MKLVCWTWCLYPSRAWRPSQCKRIHFLSPPQRPLDSLCPLTCLLHPTLPKVPHSACVRVCVGVRMTKKNKCFSLAHLEKIHCINSVVSKEPCCCLVFLCFQISRGSGTYRTTRLQTHMATSGFPPNTHANTHTHSSDCNCCFLL